MLPRPARPAGPVRTGVLIAGALAIVLAMWTAACTGPCENPTEELQVTDLTTGWFDAGIVDGKNKLVPSVSFRLKNVAGRKVASVQLYAIFRLSNDDEEWDSALARGVGPEGLAPGSTTSPVVMRTTAGYTGEQARADMLTHGQFRDARVDIHAKCGAMQWVRIAQHPVDRQLLTQ